MTTYSWKGGTGDWNVAADWAGGPPSPPPNGATAIADLTSSGAVAIASGEAFTVGGVTIGPATLAIKGTLTVDGSLNAAAGTLGLTGALVLNGDGASTISGAFTNGGTLDLDTGNGDGGGSLTIGTLANTGTALIGPNDYTLSAATKVTLGGLTNASGAYFEVWGSASHAATLAFSSASAFTSNSGNFWLIDTAPLTLSNAFTNTSTGTVALEGTAELTVTGAFTNGGALELDIVSGNGGGGLTIGGTLANTGTALIGPNDYTLSAATKVTLGGLTNASGAYFEVWGSASHAATLAFSSASAFTSNSGNFWLIDTAPLTLSNAFTNTSTGTVALEGTAELTVTGAFTNGGALELDIVSGNGGGGLTIGGTLANTGTALIGPNDYTLSAATKVTLGGLTNASGAYFEVWGSASHAATLAFSSASAFTSNSGNFWLIDTAPLTLSNAFTNTSTGTVALEGTAELTVTGAFTNGGALELDIVSGNGGGGLTIGGTLANTGTALIGPNDYTLSAATKVTLGGLTNASGAYFEVWGSASHAATLAFSSASAFTSNSGNFWLIDTAPLTLSNAFTNTSTGTVALEGTAELTVTGAFTNGGALELDIVSGNGGGGLTIGGTLANTGTALIGPNDYTLSAATKVTLGGLTNASGAYFEVWGSASHAATLAFSSASAFTSNSGNFWLIDTAPLTLSNAFTNTSTGTVALEGTAELTVTGAFTNGGALELDIVSGNGGGGLTIGGTLANTGTALIGPNDYTLSAATKVTLGGLTNASGAYFEVWGSASHAATATVSGLASNAGTVELGGTASLTATGPFTNSGALDLDISGSGGGLTIDGTLANTGTFQVGSTSLSSTTTATLGGLSNAAEINLVGGSASAKANLVVKNTATNTGTIFINAFGDLTAPNVNVTDGTLEGLGTVTGALNDTGGTVIGGTLNSTPGTLNVSGAYNQSGTGILQADINTGNAQQSSIISVTGSPGTPGAAGSVNLAGGTLLIDAESALALNTPYTVMSYGAGHLYGLFGQVKSEGALGSHTGNSTSVNLGNGDTLDVFYNEASGTVQVEMVTTPSATTYEWHVGSGTWNASSAADWSPPGNGTTPSSTSNVVIGTGGSGTVTLEQDQTINSLSITSGYTLSGGSNSIATNANVSLASGGALTLDNMNVGGAFSDSGSATLAGVLTINTGGQLTLTNGSLTGGGINGTGTFETGPGTTGTLKAIAIYKGTTYTASNTAVTDILGAIADKGAIQVNGGGGTNGELELTGAATLSGGGVVGMTTATGGGNAIVDGNGQTLTNAGDVIEGTGTIGTNGHLTVINGGTIDANSAAGTKTLILTGGEITNANGATGGLLEATNGGTLLINNITVNNAGGNVTANGGVVQLKSATIQGGTLNALGGGTMETTPGTTATLDGTTHGALTISAGSTYTASNTGVTDILGAIVDKGAIQVNGGGGTNGELELTGAATLSGGGVVGMTTATGGGNAIVDGNGQTLTNAGDVIEGTGTIGTNGHLTVINGGTIDANSAAGTKTLILTGGEITNANGATGGLLEATNGGTLLINNITVNNAGGNVTANGGVVQLKSATIQGGTLNALGGGTMETTPGTTATLDGTTHGALTISAGSTYTASNTGVTDILGAIVDKGAIQVNGGGGTNGELELTGAATLSGGGVVGMTTATGGGNAIVDGNGQTLTNAGDVIEGTGTIGTNGHLTVINDGMIDANISAGTLTLSGTDALTNTRVFEATNGGHLDVAGALAGAGKLEIGASSEVELGGLTSEVATFLSASAAKLRIDNATTTSYGGVLDSFAKGDILELGNTNATSATPTLNGANTTLTVDLSRGGKLLYTLEGNLTADTFSVTHVNGGLDSDIEIATAPAAPAFELAYSLLSSDAPSSFVESSGVFGASSNLNAPGSPQLNLAASLHPHS